MAYVFNPREIFSIFWRQKISIIAIIVLSLAIAITILSRITPRYSADSLVMIESREGSVIDLPTIISGKSMSRGIIESEIELLKSRGLVTKVIDQLQLLQSPEFNPTLKNDATAGPPLDANDQLTLTIEKFMERLSIRQKGESQAIQIRFESADPEIARRVANALADTYIQEQREEMLKATQRAAGWLQERITPLQKMVKDSETAVENFRAQSGLLKNKGATLSSEQMAELNRQWIETQSRLDDIQARIKQINKLHSQPLGAVSAPEVLESPLIQRLREQEAEVRRKLGELSAELGERHPTMIQLRSELKNLQKNTAREIKKIISGLENEAEILKDKKKSLEKNLKVLKRDVATSNKAEIQLRALERKAQANRVLLENFLTRLTETSSKEDLDSQRPIAKIISRATKPLEPSYPRKIPILFLVLFGSVLVSVLYILIRESSDRGLRDIEDVSKQTGQISLGFIPSVKAQTIRDNLHAYLLENRKSALGRSLQSLYTNIVLACPAEALHTLLFTSASAGEGKSTIAAGLASIRAITGQTTIVVDLDLRAPTLHSIFKVAQAPGVAELLTGKATLEDVIHSIPGSGLHIIPAGAPEQDPADILLDTRLGSALQILATKYDLVILDSPPLLEAQDARILSRKADATVFVAQCATTKTASILKALDLLSSSIDRLAGILINKMDNKNTDSYY